MIVQLIGMKIKKKIIENNNKIICIDNCYDDDSYKYEFKYHCYDKCPKGTHNIKDNVLFCEKNSNGCVAKYPFIKVKENSCLEECDSKDFFNNICTINNLKNYTIIQSTVIANIKKDMENGTLDIFLRDVLYKQKDIIKIDKDLLYQITTAFNQNNKEYQNISTINLGECEKILKEKYDISQNEDLIIFKIEQYMKGMLIPLIQYEIFNPISKEKLDLSYCINEDLKINLNIPVSINDNDIMKYDPNNGYYKDICYTYTTEIGIDICLFDRLYEFNRYYSICPNNCMYNGYISKKSQVICNCSIKDGISLSSKYNMSELIYKLPIKKSKIIDIFKCHKLLFSKDGLIKNIGNYIILLIIIIYIIFTFIFFLKEYTSICDQINQLLKSKFIEMNSEINKEEAKESSTDIFSSSKKTQNSNIKNNLNKSNINTNSNTNRKSDPEIRVNINALNHNNFKEPQIKKEIIKTIDYMDFEINNIPFNEAFKNDKRDFFHFYLSLLKTNHIFIVSFNKINDYNSFIIKICLFIIYLILQLVVNALFFNNSTLHQIYIDKGKFNLLYMLPHIFYSIIICSFLLIFIKRLSLTQQNILRIKHENNKLNFNSKTSIELKYIIIKFRTFFAFCFIFLILFWYHLSSFCAVYKNTQLFLIKTALISYLISFIYPFIIYLLPGFFRIC